MTPLPATNPTALVVDTRGLKCPVPVIRARRAARGLPQGAEIIVQCTDPLARIDIPHFASTDGHELVSESEHEGVIWFVLKVGARS